MTARTYKNPFTLDGRLHKHPSVSERKVKAVQGMLEAWKNGSLVEGARLHEALTTSDAIFNLTYLANLNFVPNYDEAERDWTAIAGVREVPDFRPPTLYSLNRSWTDGNGESNVLGAHGEAPVIPEGTAYPYAYISGEVAQGAGINKKGFKTDWTLEARINDGLNSLDRLPEEMLQVALDTESADVWGALTTQKTSASNFVSTVIPDPAGGTNITVPANSPLNRNAILAAMQQLSNRTINGRKIQVRGNAFNLVVPIGQAIFANYILTSQLVSANLTGTGGVAYANYDINRPDPLSGISVIESEWVTGTEWYLIPKKGSTVRPVLDRLELRGYRTPQLFVENLTGNFVGGGAVSPFEGSFDADVITLKLRQFGGGVLWDGGAAVVYSEGDGN